MNKERKNCEEIEHGVNENVYTVSEYTKAIKNAGFKSIRTFFPESLRKRLSGQERPPSNKVKK